MRDRGASVTECGVDRLDWAKGGGLLPAIVQDAATGAVLMLGYMNREALAATQRTGRVTFFSRSRGALWVKGETSGNRLDTVSVGADCDGDSILVQARPAGPVCHAGTESCFAASPPSQAARLGFLVALEAVIASRVADRSATGYTARLLAEGPRRLAQKVGEKGVEFALAAAGGDDGEVIAEGADLLFHVIVALQARGLGLSDLAAELERRHAARKAVRVGDPGQARLDVVTATP
jgi:phosphoribosyl-ATP pyrophosphohydrolase/phosphoribosyl-AMP cyclohydrolase